jgi:hypothetical protein
MDGQSPAEFAYQFPALIRAYSIARTLGGLEWLKQLVAHKLWIHAAAIVYDIERHHSIGSMHAKTDLSSIARSINRVLNQVADNRRQTVVIAHDIQGLGLTVNLN